MTHSTFSLSIFAASAKGVEHVYETPKHHEVVVTSPTSSASRSSRLSNGFYRDSGNDSMYTSSGKNFFRFMSQSKEEFLKKLCTSTNYIFFESFFSVKLIS